jgi:membrane protein implicated in regulation of membrane protease activity
LENLHNDRVLALGNLWFCFVLGGIVFIFPMTTVAVQLTLFGVIALAATVVGRKVMRNISKGTAPLLLNRRGQQFVGESLMLDAPILNGHAHITVGDSKWLVKGADLPSGTVVTVVGVEGNMLIVEAKKS